MEIREEKAAIIGIFIKDFDAVPKVNGILHDYAEDIIGRIGIPCRDRDLHVISIILSTTPDTVRFPASLDELKGSRQRPCRRIYRRISL